MKKLVCLDTETTGFSSEFDRIVEIGCVDISNGWNNRKSYQQYINPKRSVPKSAFEVHGLDDAFLSQFQSFDCYIDDFLMFIKDAVLIIHNATFDLRFLNAELERYGKPKIENEVIDTLLLAKKNLPGKKASLSALQSHFNINMAREKHGALIDSEILAQVYFAMLVEQTDLVMQDSLPTYGVKPSQLEISVSIDEIELNEEVMCAINKN